MIDILKFENITFVTCCNSIPHNTTIENGIPVIEYTKGGLSGTNKNKTLSIELIKKIRNKMPDLTIIGCGGISNGDDINDYLNAGANAVQIGTVLWREGIKVFDRLNIELKKYKKQNCV